MSSAPRATSADRALRTIRLRRRLPAALGIAGVLEVLVILAIAARGGERFPIGRDVVGIGFLATIATYSVVGGLIAQQRPASRVPWLMIAIGNGVGAGLAAFGYGIVGVSPEHAWPAAVWALVLSQLLFLPTIALFATSLLLAFPDDRLMSPRWRGVLGVAAAASVLSIVGSVFRPGALPTDLPPVIPNPLGAAPALAAAFDVAIIIANALAIVAIALAVGSLVIRYRRADPVHAAQIRWLALVGVAAAPTLALGALQVGPISDVGFSFGVLALAAMPIAIGVAVTRYRLYEIDRLINRTLVYGSLTAILAGVFTAAVGLAQRLFVAVTGETSDAAIVGTTLIVATLYAPLRKRLEGIVDRRFKYDHSRFGAYRDELTRHLSLTDPTKVAERLANEAIVELRALGAAVLAADGSVTASAGSWPVAEAIRLPIPGDNAALAALVAGGRLDDAGHAAARVADLAAVVELAARAVRPGR